VYIFPGFSHSRIQSRLISSSCALVLSCFLSYFNVQSQTVHLLLLSYGYTYPAMALQPVNAITTDLKTGVYDHVEVGERRASTAPSERGDKAKDLLAHAGHTVELTPESNKRVLSLIDKRILPVVLFIYFLQSLDKATLSYASVFGLVKGAHLHGLQYSWLGSVVYLAQLVVQPLIAYCLVKLPVGKFLAFTVFSWGAVLSCMPAANRFGGLLVCRMFLGMFEGGVGN
jgi:hypothetical protein